MPARLTARLLDRRRRHGRIDLPAGTTLAIGDVVEIMPPHCYQTVIMYSHYHCVRGDDLVDIWPVDAFQNG